MTLTQTLSLLDRKVRKQPTVAAAAAAVYQFQAAVTSWFPLALLEILPVLAHPAACNQKPKNSHILKS